VAKRDPLPPRYDPRPVEDRIYRLWLDGRYFHSEPDPTRQPYTIMIPPPNVTDILHMGHALNNVIQDILIRFRRMQGRNALWLPGTDHAGIATQNVVERQLAGEGTDRWRLGRERFIERVWQWKAEYGSRIIGQLKRLGCSCDWERERFTMDAGLSRAVREAFVTLHEQGLLYRGRYMVNWCPRCRTALSDDEVEHEEHQGYLWHIKYPLRDDPRVGVVVATTRPETMLGDTAVAVHPDDERYRHLVGEVLVLPVVEREIPVIADRRVDPSFGTGAVKVTPAHDPNDFEIGREHGLDLVNVLNEDATLNEAAGNYAGQDRYECREALVEELKAKCLLQSVTPHVHSVGHCYRCHTVLEPYVSEQWFVRMKPLAERALAASDAGEVRFVPARWERVYRQWLENVRDWCVSRQLWWGHRIPVWYCDACGEVLVAREDPDRCASCGSTDIRQDEDVLDTWFSSALWPFSTLGWPERTRDLEYYYPTDVLVTDRGIIYLWVARMVMNGLNMMGRAPFSHVFIHATILDELGRKMSKSLGNGIDPVEMIEKYGTDAVRYSLMMLTVEQQDVRLSEKKFEIGRNFVNKVWNAARFVLSNLDTDGAETCDPSERTEDRWILSRLGRMLRTVTDALERFRFNEAAVAIYDFTWREFCDWYVEIVKPRLQAHDAQVRGVLVHVLDSLLRVLHPFAPFVTEEIWQRLRPHLGASLHPWESAPAGALVVAAWPDGQVHPECPEVEREMDLLQSLIRSVREIRSRMAIPDSRRLAVQVAPESTSQAALLQRHEAMFRTLAGVDQLRVEVGLKKPPSCASDVVRNCRVFVPLEGVIDLAKERERLGRRMADAEKHLAASDARLANDAFLRRAPDHVVAAERHRNRELRESLEMLRRNLADLE